MAKAHRLAHQCGSALRSGNAGVTTAMKLPQLRCRDSQQPQDFSCYSPSNFLWPTQGIPAMLHRGEGCPLAGLAGSLLISDLLDEDIRE